jgi:arginine-tRNA-protein transferase
MDSKPSSHINLNYCHGYDKAECGYCKKKDTHVTCGLKAKKLTTNEYQEMMDRGWRRCGDYYYQPDNSKQCCKMLTIRLDTLRFQIRNSHKKVMKRF